MLVSCAVTITLLPAQVAGLGDDIGDRFAGSYTSRPRKGANATRIQRA